MNRMDDELDSDDGEFHLPSNLDEAEVNEGSDEEMDDLEDETESANIEVPVSNFHVINFLRKFIVFFIIFV